VISYHLVNLKAVPWFRRLVAGFPTRGPGFESRSGHVGFVVVKRNWGRSSPSTLISFGNSLRRLLHIHYHPSSVASTVGKIMVDVPIGLGLIPAQETKNN
jgi:hypothetical protein